MSSTLGLSPQSSPVSTEPDVKKSIRKRGIIAFVLSVIQPGLGQIYNRQPIKAIAYFVFWGAFLLLYRALNLWNSFAGFAAFIIILGSTALYMIVQATRAGFRHRTVSETPKGSRPSQIIAIGLAVVVIVANGNGFIWDRAIAIRAFKVPSESMSPTIRFGDRIVANMQAYAKNKPNRGVLVLFLLSPNNTLLLKRVAGVEGDTIEIDHDNVVLNGVLVEEPYLEPANSAADTSGDDFGSKKVPEGAIYVMGDNRRNSYDSRYFGVVKLSQVRGKALFIYWSSDHARIGKLVQ
jgi:signal peptidase I